jgi:aminopeptidase N
MHGARKSIVFIMLTTAVMLLSTGKAGAQLLTGEELIKSEGRRWDQGFRLRNFNRIDYGYDMHFQRLRLKVNPAASSQLEGRVSLHFRALKNLDTLVCDLRDNLTVHGIQRAGLPLNFSHRQHRLYIALPAQVAAGGFDSLEIHYSGFPDRGNGFGYYVRDRHQTGDIIHTLSQPYGAPYWWPCMNSLSDKVDSIDIAVTTAKGFRVASNGLLKEERSLNDTEVLFHWQHRYPVAPYLVAIAVSNYVPFTDHAHFHDRPDSLPVLNYVFPQSFSSARVETKVTLPMLRMMDSLFGPYPFMKEKYGHAQFTWGGGMEHQTMSFMVNFSFDLTAHELAHMWFGDAVTCGSWEDLWLNEGWATYVNALCYEFLQGPFEFQARLRDMQRYVKSKPDGSVFPADTQSINRLFDGRLTYNKGALVMHMLRWEMGDSLFFHAVREYLSSPLHQYGFARTADFRRIMEAVSGRDLGWFFSDWYSGEGYPIYQIDWLQTGTRLKIQMRQTTSHPSVSFYDIKVPLLLRGMQGDTLLVLEPTGRESAFEVDVNTQVTEAVFDPDAWLLAEASVSGRNANIPLESDIRLFPNPARGNIQVYARMQRIEQVDVYDASGRHCLSRQIPGDLYGGAVDIRSLSSGVYAMKVTASGGIYITKFEVQ